MINPFFDHSGIKWLPNAEIVPLKVNIVVLPDGTPAPKVIVRGGKIKRYGFDGQIWGYV